MRLSATPTIHQPRRFAGARDDVQASDEPVRSGGGSLRLSNLALSATVPGMRIILIAILGIASGAFCVWLAVRLINRRKKSRVWLWATAVLIALPILYPLSVGPVQWTYWRFGRPRWIWSASETVYAPLVSTIEECPFEIQSMYRDYVKWWSPDEPAKKR